MIELKHTSEVFNEDCMVGMARYPDKYFDLAVVDPPYGIGDFSNKKREDKPYNKNTHVSWNFSAPTNEYFDELHRIAKNHIVFGFQYYMRYLWDDLTGVIIHDFGSTGGFGSDCDLAITNMQKRVVSYKYRWQGFIRGNEVDTDQNRIHPCEKPVSLYYWIYKNYLPQGGKVIDTHLGSGSNRIAANRAGNIDFVGFELDKDYYEAQEKRWKGFISQTRLF